jgi:DNA-binding NarL/FixJ family response regulator
MEVELQRFSKTELTKQNATVPAWQSPEFTNGIPISANGYFGLLLLRMAPGLTATELRVATLIREAKRSCEIAAQLSITEHTVENHRSSLRKKLQLLPTQSLSIFLSSVG